MFIKVGLEGLSPAQVVLARMVGGALALVVLTLLTRAQLPGLDRVWLHVAVVAVLLCVAPFLIFAWAEQFIASSLASIYNATTPLMTMLMAIAALPDERPTRRRLLGLGLGFGGVLVVLAPWDGRMGGSVAAQLGCLAATASYGAAFVYLRRFVAHRGLPALTVATMQVGIGGVIMVLLAPVIAHDSVVLSAKVVNSMVLWVLVWRMCGTPTWSWRGERTPVPVLPTHAESPAPTSRRGHPGGSLRTAPPSTPKAAYPGFNRHYVDSR